MLKAFFNQLRYLAEDKNDPFQTHVQKRVGKKGGPELVAELKEAILLMPGIMSSISVLWSLLKEGSRVKGVGSYFVTYMYKPRDFIPEDEAHGLFGYLDDAYLAILVHDLITDELIRSGAALPKESEQIRKKIKGMKGKIKSVIPDEAAKIKQMIGEILLGEDAAFNKLFS